MRVHEAWEQNDIAQVQRATGVRGRKIFPTPNAFDAIAGDQDRAVFNRRLLNRKDEA
jgi:hypothetical protein